MAIVFKGDSGNLKKLMDGLAKTVRPQFRRDIMAGVAEESLELAQRCFHNGADPYGVSWKPSKTSRRERRAGGAKRKGPGQILRETNRLLGSIRRGNVSSGSFTLATNVRYAAVHQFGGTITQGNRTNAHRQRGARKGQFIKKSSNRTRSMRVSFTAAHSWRMPRRAFFPDSRGLPDSWSRRYESAFTDARKALLGE
jgi:phage virion morphogenesis protein